MRYIRCYNTKEECNENEYVENESGDVTCLTKLDPEVVYVRNIEETLYNCLQPGPTPPVEDFTISFYGKYDNSQTDMFTFNSRTVSAQELIDVMYAVSNLYPYAVSFSFFDESDESLLYSKYKSSSPDPSTNPSGFASYFFGDLGWDSTTEMFPQSLDRMTCVIVPFGGVDSK